MKSKFFMYFIPVTLLCILVLGYSFTELRDNPKNDSAPELTLTDQSVNISGTKLNSVKISKPVPTEFDTIAPTGFPYATKFNWNYSAIANVNAGTVGAITFKNKWYLNRWNSATNYRYNNNGTGGGPGTFADSNSAYNAGAGAIRDLTTAPDGSGTTYLWGGSGSTILYKLDSLGNYLASYTHTGAGYRAIAWDPNRKGFWSCGFNDNIVCRDTAGVVKGTITASTITGKYGLGFDSSTVADSAYLWIWRQISTSQNGLERLNLLSGLVTESYIFNNTGVSVGLAGGAEVYKIDTNVYLALNYQNQAVVSYDIKHKNPIPAADVGVTAINVPSNVVNVGSLPVTPSVVVKNFGSATQSFNVKVDITGGYTSTVAVGPLAPNASATVNTFAAWNPPLGRYTVTATTILPADANPANNSKTSGTEVYRPNWGGGYAGTGGYYFANSTDSGSFAPSNPKYKRIDTAGSTSLVVNSVASVPVNRGSLDDGQWNLINPGGLKKVKFMGTIYDTVFVGTNGIIAFTNFDASASGNWYPPTGGLPGTGAGSPPVRPAFYPLWNDLDWGDVSVPINRLSYKVDATKSFLLITYDKAPIFGATLPEENQTMQICLELQDPTVVPNSNITVYFDSSSYAFAPALGGLQNASGSEWLQYFYSDGVTPENLGPYYETGDAGVAIAYGPDPNDLGGCCKVLNLTYNLEACSSPVLTTVYLRAGTNPYAIIDSASGFGGDDVAASFDFPGALNGVPYYIVVKTINSVETWSATTVTFSGLNASYDFTASVGQAYGNNQVLSSGIPSIYQGDANQDGFVDLTDVTLVYNDASNFTTSPSTDFDCNGTTDLTDLILAFNNAKAFIQIRRP